MPEPLTPAGSEQGPKLPDPGRIEMQRQLLLHMQQDVSNDLFGNGTVTTIVGKNSPSNSGGKPQPIKGADLLDRMYLPTVVNIGDPGHMLEEFSLTLAKPDPETGEARIGNRYTVGTRDEYGIFVPKEGVDPEAAEAVLNAALSFRRAQEAGELPQLRYDLLRIVDVRMALGNRGVSSSPPTQPET